MRSALVMLCLATTAGCAMGSAYVYQQDLRGGVLALQGDEKKAIEDAHAKMAAHCGAGNYRVYKRETVVVGQEQYTDTMSDYSETGERQREEATETEHQEDTEYEYDQTTDTETVTETVTETTGPDPGTGPATGAQTWTGTGTDTATDTSGGGSSSTVGSGSSTTVEDEREQRQGQATSRTVSGTREVREPRIHYVCGTTAPGASQ